MKTYTYLLLGLIVALSACNGSKKTAKKDTEPKVEAVKNNNSSSETEKGVVEATDPEPSGEGENEKDVMPHGGTTTKVSAGDSLYFGMERTPCYGRCPIYKIEVYDSGYALYEGIQFTEKEGIYFARLTKEQMQKIDSEAKKIRYFKLEDKYDSPITDIPSTITSLKRNGERKKVIDRHNAPPQLKNFETAMEQMLLGLEWKPKTGGSKN